MGGACSFVKVGAHTALAVAYQNQSSNKPRERKSRLWGRLKDWYSKDGTCIRAVLTASGMDRVGSYFKRKCKCSEMLQ